MAHYAFIDENNFVEEVIVGIDENVLIENKNPEDFYSELRGKKCIRTSYNANIRKNFAGIGYLYDEIKDAFIPPKPEIGDWYLDEISCTWIEVKDVS